MNQALLGDCLELMKDIPSGSIDMILCDLPYGTTACKWDTIIPFEPLWEHYERVIKDNGVIVLTGSEPFSSHLRLSNLKLWRYDWIWNKIQGANFFNLGNRPFKTQEQVMVFSKTADFTFNPIRVARSEKSLKRDPVGVKPFRIGNSSNKVQHYGFEKKYSSVEIDVDGKKHPIDIIKFSSVEKGRYQIKHPTKKPVALFEYLIKTYTNEGDTVLDNCAGSFTTAIACLNTDRNYICMEKEPEYFEKGIERIEKWHEEQEVLKQQLKLF